MIDQKSFIKEIDTPFWKHITKETPFKDIVNYKDIDKNKFLLRICEKLNSYDYHFKLPLYLYVPKSQGVVRKVKIYSISDTSIYYYCVKLLEEQISKVIKKNPNVFGGFRMTSKLKLTEEELNKLAFDPTYENPFNRVAFRKEWSDYQKLARALYDNKYKYYIHLDITHFYDDINLDILERNLRNALSDKQNVIDILFYFLRNSDKRDLGYNPSNVGIPQENMGEMSRLLANFYLNMFDREIRLYFKNVFKNQEIIYTRYADDLWICFNGQKEEAKKIIQVISFYLQKLKLHLNESKISILNRREFFRHWHFSDWERIEKIKRSKAYYSLFNRLANPEDGIREGRWFSPANYSLRVILRRKDVRYIKNVNEAKRFINTLLENPKITERLRDDLYYFVKELIKKYPAIVSYLKNYLRSPKNIYPHLEYFILSFLVRYYRGKNRFDYFYSYYKNSQVLEYHWYLRVICQKYFFQNLSYFHSAHFIKRRELLNLVEKKIGAMNVLERRHTIYFLIRLNTDRSHKILKKHFTNDEDISFMYYLRGNA